MGKSNALYKVMVVVPNIPEEEQIQRRKRSDSDVFEEFVGYLGKGNTDEIMHELRGSVDSDKD